MRKNEIKTFDNKYFYLMPLPMSIESESKEATVASSEALTRWYNLPEEVLVLHQT